MKTEVKTARGKDGSRLTVGANAEAFDIYNKRWTGRIVRIIRLYRQGADGTIATTEPAPVADYPYHFSHRASEMRLSK